MSLKIFTLILLLLSLNVKSEEKKRPFYYYRQDGMNAMKFSIAYNNTIDEKAYSIQKQQFNRGLGEIATILNNVHFNLRSGQSLEEILGFNADQIRAISPKCLDDLYQVHEDFKLGVPYALRMFDAFALPQSGILEGNVRWPGRYYECITSVGPNFTGKYYTSYYGYKFVPVVPTYPIDVAFGTCYPSSCSNETAHQLNPTIFIPKLRTLDSDWDKTFDTPTIIGIVVSVLIAFAACVGFTYHFYCHYKEIKKEKRNKYLICFSPYENARKICDDRPNPAAIQALDGIRFISTLWVIIGHTYLFLQTNIENTVVIGKTIVPGFLYMIMLNGTFSVDTFFCIGGLLVAYLTLKQVYKSSNMNFIPIMYLKRYLRLTPVYAYLILFNIGLYKYFGDGPYWKQVVKQVEASQCKDVWWSNLLYINTLYPISNGCFGWAWYLCHDMIFYILAPFCILTVKYSKTVGVLVLLAILTINITMNTWMSVDGDLAPAAIWQVQSFKIWYRIFFNEPTGEPAPPPTKEDWANKFKRDNYYNFYCRIGAWAVGMLAGILLYYKNKKVKMHKVVVFLGWLVSVTCALLIVFGLFGYTKDQEFMRLELNAFYNGVTRPAFAACVAWVVIACSSGYGGPATKFLDLKVFRVLARLTYSAYLVHPFVIWWYSGTSDQPIHFTEIAFVYIYMASIVLVFIIAFFLALLIEWPFQELFRLLLPNGKRVNKSLSEKETEKAYHEFDLEDISTSNTESSYSEKHDVNYENIDQYKTSQIKGNDKIDADQSLKQRKNSNTYTNVAFIKGEETLF